MRHADEHPVFIVSDRSGHTAETLAKSLLAQFPHLETKKIIFPFTSTREQADRVASAIDKEIAKGGKVPLVFSTLVEEELQDVINATGACVVELFRSFIGPMEDSLGVISEHRAGVTKSEVDDSSYQKRMKAIAFSLKNDDGVMTGDYKNADVIITGVSRTGKTPTCIYLAMNFGINACNYPLVSEDLSSDRLPRPLLEYKDKVVGLTINPMRLRKLRESRRSGTEYSSKDAIAAELKRAENIFENENVKYYETSDMSIEEIASSIIKDMGLLTEASWDGPK